MPTAVLVQQRGLADVGAFAVSFFTCWIRALSYSCRLSYDLRNARNLVALLRIIDPHIYLCKSGMEGITWLVAQSGVWSFFCVEQNLKMVGPGRSF